MGVFLIFSLSTPPLFLLLLSVISYIRDLITTCSSRARLSLITLGVIGICRGKMK